MTMKAIIVFIILSLILATSGCFGNPYSSLSQPQQQQLQPKAISTPIQELPPHLRVTQHNQTNQTVHPITQSTPETTYNITITTLDYNSSNGNASIVIEFPLNGTMILNCNNADFPLQTIDTIHTNNKNTTLYSFIVLCPLNSHGILSISEYSQKFTIPSVFQTWHFKINQS